MTCGIYAIEHLTTGRRYVGSSVEIEHRWNVHKRFLRKGIHWSRRLQGSWNKHGEAAFQFKVLEVVVDPNFILPREQCWIWRCNAVGSGYNTLEMPDRLSGYRHTAEARARMSEMKMGRISPKRGVPLSDEQKRKMSAARKGKAQPEWWRKKAALTRIGKKRSADTKARMSASWTAERKAAQAERSRLRWANYRLQRQ